MLYLYFILANCYAFFFRIIIHDYSQNNKSKITQQNNQYNNLNIIGTV